MAAYSVDNLGYAGILPVPTIADALRDPSIDLGALILNWAVSGCDPATAEYSAATSCNGWTRGTADAPFPTYARRRDPYTPDRGDGGPWYAFAGRPAESCAEIAAAGWGDHDPFLLCICHGVPSA